MTCPIPLWLDCDPGHDDAILMLIGNFMPQYYNLLGVSTVHGNSTLVNTTKNALSLQTVFEKPEVKVYPGAASALTRKTGIAAWMHGESGLDGTELPTPATTAQPDDSAVEGMAAAIEAYPGEISICATGSLTNIANLVTRRPDVLPKIKFLSIMGGGIRIGNWSNEFAATNNFRPFEEMCAEFNIWADPDAAKIVLTNQILAPKTMLAPLDVTHTACASKEFINTMKGEGGSKVRNMFYELYLFVNKAANVQMGFEDGNPVHDPLTVCGLLPLYGIPNKLDVKYTRYQMDVVVEGENQGQTLALKQSENGVMIMEYINVQEFFNVVYEALGNLESYISLKS